MLIGCFISEVAFRMVFAEAACANGMEVVRIGMLMTDFDEMASVALMVNAGAFL